MNIKITELLEEAKELDESFLMPDIKALEKLVDTDKATIASVAFKRLQSKVNDIAEAQLVADEVVYGEADEAVEAVADDATVGDDEAVEAVEVEQEIELDDDDVLEVIEVVDLGHVDVEADTSSEVENPIPDDADTSSEVEEVTADDVEEAATIISNLDVIHSPSAMLRTAIDEAHMLDVSCAEVALRAESTNLGSVNDADQSERLAAIDTQTLALEVSNALDTVKRVKDNVGKPVGIKEAEAAAEIVDALRDDEIVSHVNIAKLAVVNAKNVQAIKKSNGELRKAVVTKLAEVQAAVTEAEQLLHNLTE